MDNKQLENRILAVEKWKAEKEKQQITFPLDARSIDILSKYLMRITGDVKYIGGVAAREFTKYIGVQGDRNFILEENNYTRYTVNVTTNYVTLIDSRYRFPDGQDVYVATDGTLPGGLSDGVPYYVINASGNTFQLSTTPGGAAIDITSSGTGAQYIYFF